jgi:hypothetical protein
VRRRLPCTIICLLAPLALPTGAVAADSFVDDDGAGTSCTQAAPCPTIAEGITAAGAGETVHVANGTYDEAVTLGGDKSLVGSGGNTVIDASGNADQTASVTVPAGGDGEIRGFVFSDDGTGEQYAIVASDSSPTISTNDFAGFFYGVFALNAGASPTITGNEFTGAHSITTGNGSEIILHNGATGVIADNLFDDPGGTSPTGLILSGGGATVRRNTFINHLVSVSNTTSPVSFEGDLITRANDLYAFCASDNGSDDPDVGDATLTNVTFWNNAGSDICAVSVDLALDSTIVQDAVGTFGTASCAISFSRGPTTTGSSCQTFQTGADPLFVDAAADDYHLSTSSPMLDAGNPAAPVSPTDFEGDPRVLDGPDGGTCTGADSVRDIGADELDCRPPPDTDGDGVPDASDDCPAIAGQGPAGCPTVPRSVSIAYSRRAEAFKGRADSEASACKAGEEIQVFKRRQGPDRLIGADQTSERGRYAIGDPGRPGRYYARATQHTEPSVGICQGARSATLRLR